MDRIYMITISIIIIIAIGLIICNSNLKLKKQAEKFTALVGLNPLTTYDDYGTFNFLLHTDDLPYYDKGFAGMFCGKPDYVPEIRKPDINTNIDFDTDSFISYEGFKVRRELVPSNYVDGSKYGNIDLNENDRIIIKNRPKASILPPAPHNYYFG